jgi:RNA polymerase sigma-70 factor (ECF subfamily)
MQPQGEQQLIDAARRGDRAAIGALLAEQQPRLYRFGLKMCGDPEDAQEVLQDAMLAAARALPRFEGRSSLTTWLYTIARSFCIKRRRRSKFAPAADRSLEGDARQQLARLADPAPPSDERYAAAELRLAVEGALADLEPEQREVVVLRDIEELSAAEAAQVLGIGVPALKSRLHRARAALRARLAPVLGELGPGQPGCPDILAMFSGYLEGEISADTCARMQEHLAGCDRCRDACDSLKQALDLCKTPLPAVPADVQQSVRRALQRALSG